MRNVWFGVSIASPPYGSFQWSSGVSRSVRNVRQGSKIEVPVAMLSLNGGYLRRAAG
jgi:hypothetical protein